jgi:hypothetical protein
VARNARRTGSTTRSVTPGSAPTRRDPSAPKGRPTPGRKQRNAEARARARRHRRIVRLWWAGLAVVVLGTLTALIVTGTV